VKHERRWNWDRGRNRNRPSLELELRPLGMVDPFTLELGEDPPGSGEFFVGRPGAGPERVRVERAGVNLAGAGQALLSLAMRWLSSTGAATDLEGVPGEAGPPPVAGEARLLLRRRETRLLASLLRRHLQRLPEPPSWMPELQHALEEIDVFLSWELS